MAGDDEERVRRPRGRPGKSLEQHVKDGTFRIGSHHLMLAGPDVPWKTLAKFQAAYRLAAHDIARRHAARDFANEIPRTLERVRRSQLTLQQELDRLGPPKSVERVRGFFPRFFRHYEGPKAGKRFRLEPYQDIYIADAYDRHRARSGEPGPRKYSLCVFGLPKGNGKTPQTAVQGAYALVDADDVPSVLGLAGARNQAGFAQKFVKWNVENGDLGRFLHVSGNVVSCPENGGVYTLLSADGNLSQGTNPSAGLVDELWQFRHRQQREGWLALVEALQKRGGESFVQAISQAYEDDDSVLAEIHQAVLKHPLTEEHNEGCLLILRDPDSQTLVHWYGAPEDADIEDDRILRLCNPLSTLSIRDLRAALLRPGANEDAWRRLHLNQPTKVRDSWLKAGLWNSLTDADLEIPVGAGIYVGIDAARSHDTTAVAWGWKAPDGRVVLRAHVWGVDLPHLTQGAHYHTAAEGKEIANEDLVIPFVQGLGAVYRIEEIAFDPRYFGTEARALANDGFTVIEVHPQSAPMGDAVTLFEQDTGKQLVAHDGDPVIRKHLEAVQSVGREAGTKLYHPRNRPIDAAIGCVLANYRARLGDSSAFVGGFDQ